MGIMRKIQSNAKIIVHKIGFSFRKLIIVQKFDLLFKNLHQRVYIKVFSKKVQCQDEVGKL